MPTSEEIEAARTRRGGWTQAQLAEWGVPWPPPRGWRKKLEQGLFSSSATSVSEAKEREVRKLTRAASAERARITAVYDQAVSRTVRALLTSGSNKLTRAEQRAQDTAAKAFVLATDCLRHALEETNPDQSDSSGEGD